ncbi:pseudouridine-5'-phosphate glycosidase [Halocola ammonii]
MNQKTDLLVLSAEVESALKENRPVVALESTIISHGMPFPENLKTAQALEDIVRAEGTVPATVAVMDGKLRAGLSESQLERLAKEEDVLKLSRFDLPLAISQKKTGATTVAATMIVARMAGVKFFATGGVGGVHRGAEKTFDVSADLTELAQTEVAVISAGVKSILDIPKTLEKLETLGVPVIGFQTSVFPAFYSRESGVKVPIRLDSTDEVVSFLKAKWGMGLRGGALIANPIANQNSLDREFIEPKIEEAIAEAEKKGVSGKELTPFLLDRIEKITRGKSLEANIELVKSNAQLAARLAVAYSK